MKKTYKSLCIRIGNARLNELKKAAEQHGMAASALARVIVFRYLDTLGKNGKTITMEV